MMVSIVDEFNGLPFSTLVSMLKEKGMNDRGDKSELIRRLLLRKRNTDASMPIDQISPYWQNLNRKNRRIALELEPMTEKVFALFLSIFDFSQNVLLKCTIYTIENVGTAFSIFWAHALSPPLSQTPYLFKMATFSNSIPENNWSPRIGEKEEAHPAPPIRRNLEFWPQKRSGDGRRDGHTFSTLWAPVFSPIFQQTPDVWNTATFYRISLTENKKRAKLEQWIACTPCDKGSQKW